MSKTKVYISAEFIEPYCGLGNYIVLLEQSLKKYQPDIPLEVRTRENFESDYHNTEFVEQIGSFKKTLKPYVPKPILRLLHKFTLRKHASLRKIKFDEITASLRRLPDNTVCVLPHNPLWRQAVPYYKEIMKKRLVWVIHDLHPYYFPHAWSAESIEVCNFILPELAAKAEAIIVHNDFTAESVVKYLGVSKAKINIVRLPYILNVDKLSVKKNPEEVYNRHQIRKPFALWASSNTNEHKNHKRLIQSWAKVQSNFGYRIQLVCTGDTAPNWQSISELLRQYGSAIDVVFTGSIPVEDYAVLLRNATIAVCPTLFEGGGCGPAMEAVYAKIPIACSEIPQINEQFGGRKDLCRFFDPYDCDDLATQVSYLFANPAEAQSMAERSYEWAISSRTWEQVAEEYGKVIEKVSNPHAES